MESIYIILSICLSVRPHGITRLPLDGFSLSLIFEDFSKLCRDKSSFIKIGQECRMLYMKTKTHFYHGSLIFSWKEKCFRQTLQRKSRPTFCVQFENRAVYEIMWKNTAEWGRPLKTMARAHYMLGT